MIKPKFIDWAILALGTALRTLMMWLPLTGDEADSFLWFVTKPVANIMRVYDLPTNHILHSIITHFSCQIFGLSEWAVRLPVFLAGVGLIALVWYAGQLVADVRVARLAALFTSCSTVLCYYSQSARGYSIGAFLAMGLGIIAYKWPQRRKLTVLALGSFACLYNNPSALIFVVPLFVWLWREEGAISPLVWWVVSLTAVAYWPLTVYAPMWARSHAEMRFDGWYHITETLRMCSRGLFPSWVLCGLLALGIRQIPRTWTLLVWAAVAALAYHWVPALAFFPRSWTILFPFVYLICANSCMTLWNADYEKVWRLMLALSLGVFMVTGVAEYAADARLVFDPLQHVRIECRELANLLATQVPDHSHFRGNTVCDGVAMSSYAQYYKKKQSGTIEHIFYFSNNYKEVLEYCRELSPRVVPKVLARCGSVVAYEVVVR